MQEVISLLDRTMLFATLHPSHKEQVAQVMQRLSLQPGQGVFEEGDPADALYIVESGSVSVFARNRDLGVELEVARLDPGQVFGEIALLTEAPRNASVRALVATTCLVLPRPVFLKICEQLPQVMLAVVKTLAKRLDEVNRERGIQFASLSSLKVDPETYKIVPAQILEKHRMIPLNVQGAALTLAMVNPGDVMGLDDVRRCLHGIQVSPVAISDEDYRRFMERRARATQVPAAEKARMSMTAQRAGADWQKLQVYSDAEDAAEDKRASSAVQGPEIVALVNQVLAEAVDREASDVHLDCERLAVSVRYRIDGQLQQREKTVPRSHYRPLVSRIKIMAGMDIAEKRLPQDGRFSFSYGQRDIDVRVASMPARSGERIAMRMLEAGSGVLDIENLILADKLAQVVRRLIFKPSGAVLVTGPTGSGKTTTLYSLLRERMRYQNDRNIVTVEDPIEYALSGIAQVEVNEAVGLTFPRVLKGFLRHDPDIILVGETRDGVTARIAMEASITGHLVMTSMHTNSALGSVVRLRDMGIEPYMIATALSGVVAQRLVRRLCPLCTVAERYPDSVVQNLARAGVLGEGENPDMAREVGCENCEGTGFRGRVGVYEVLQVEPGFRQLVAAGAPAADLRKEALARGMVPLQKYAGFLLRSKLTVPSEVLRILASDE